VPHPFLHTEISLTLLRQSNSSLKNTSISPRPTLVLLRQHLAPPSSTPTHMLYMLSQAWYRSRPSGSVKQDRTGGTILAKKGGISSFNAMATPARPINPPLRVANVLVTANIASSWSMMSETLESSSVWIDLGLSALSHANYGYVLTARDRGPWSFASRSCPLSALYQLPPGLINDSQLVIETYAISVNYEATPESPRNIPFTVAESASI
jgi:hypothetical protein